MPENSEMVMVYLEPGAYLFWAFLLIVLPLPWLLSAMLAALWHEWCHLVMVQLWDGSVNRISIGFTGVQIEAAIPNGRGRILSVLAGPLGSLLLCLLYFWQPKLAVCAFFQGLYNFLPIRPLDGGQLLDFVLESSCPNHGMWIQNMVEGIVLAVLFLTAAPLVSDWRMILLLLLPVYGRFRRKIPCKQKQFRVQ